MTEKGVRIVGRVAVTSDLFRNKILTNPGDLIDVLLTATSELDDQDVVLIKLAIDKAAGDPRTFFRDLDRLTRERYHPKPPWAV